MPALNPQEVIENQRKDWNRVAPAWEKWDQLIDRNLMFINYRLVGDARLGPGKRVLDLGSGTGYPAIVAAQAVGIQGQVIGLDLAEDMLVFARKKAETLRLENLQFHAADVTTLSFESASFDAVISRFCLMFLPDIPKAVGEMARVLKPGGYVSVAVWSGPEKNPFVSIPMNVLKTFLELPPPDPDQPGIFRLANPGDLGKMLESARLKVLSEEELTGESFYESADQYYSSLMDLAAPLQPLFAQLSSRQKKEAEAQIINAVNAYSRNMKIHLPMAIRYVVARKPF